MLLSRLWYVILSGALAAAVLGLFLATSMFDRSSARATSEALQADSQVVSWYLKEDARLRAAQLIKFAVSPEIQKHLAKSTESEAKVPKESREKIMSELRAVNGEVEAEFAFDAVFAVDQHGRVVAHLGYEQASGMEDFELGGYPVVADALHGYIRDDTLVLDRVYRVVARPVEFELGSLPAGAIIGARIVDEKFARELSTRTGAAVAFYSGGQRIAAGAPEGFDRSQLDAIVGDIDKIDADPDYSEKGRSNVRDLGRGLGVVYARLPGEAWELGAGYAVGRVSASVGMPTAFFTKADDKDKASVSYPIVGGIALLGILLGLIFSLAEHTSPLNAFKHEAEKLAGGTVDTLAPSKFRGVFRKIASDVNDGIEKVAAKGGAPRRAADLGKVLGDIPAQPAMSAFSLPGADGSASEPPPVSSPRAAAKPTPPAPGGPKPKPAPPAPGPRVAGKGLPRPPRPPGAAAEEEPAPESAVPASAEPEPEGTDAGEAATDTEWQKVYRDFLALKQESGENVEGFTYEKFEPTLIKYRDALEKSHGAKRVKFTVYAKDGKAALKASPIKD